MKGGKEDKLTEEHERRSGERSRRRPEPTEPAGPARQRAEVPGLRRPHCENSPDRAPLRRPRRREDRGRGAEAVAEEPHAAVELRSPRERVAWGAIRRADPVQRVQDILGVACDVRVGAGGGAGGAHGRAEANHDEAVGGEVGDCPEA